ncbi:hypothetical protein [Anaerococcus tetradius]|uniref:hypothetical protein n=1 Tax=Anaerococcus tetradius TaxID=33036 RepID=UPI0023F189A0|nr:hypothetical protein [Anaerococcus tetradius]
MDKFVKLAFDSLKHYLDTGSYLSTYDKEFENNHNGVLIEINIGDKRERAGSIYPTRKNIALDIINETVNLGIFNNALALKKEDLDDVYIQVLEINKVTPIGKIEDFGVYHGLLLNYKNNPVIVYRNDYESDYQMFEDAKDRANLDDFDVYNLEKFKIIRHI